MKLQTTERQDSGRHRSSTKASTTCSCEPTTSTFHLLRRAGDRFREVTSRPTGPATMATPAATATPRSPRSPRPTSRAWGPSGSSPLPNTGRLQVTPVVVGGIMYVTSGQRMLRPGCRHRPPDLALPASAHQRHARRCEPAASIAASPSPATASSWQTDDAHLHRLEPLHRRIALGHRDRRLASELLRHVRAARRRLSGGGRCRGRRTWLPRIPRRLRSVHRQGGVALLDRAQARRAGLRNLAGQRHRARRRAHLVHRHLRRRSSTRSSGPPAIPAPNTMATIAWATTSTPIASSRSTPKPASSSGITRSTPARPLGLGRHRDARRGRRRLARAASQTCCCRPIATASSTSSTAPTASSCWPSRSSRT